jgi:hypothetical protein
MRSHFLLLLLCIVALALSSHPRALPSLSVYAETHFDLGFQIGSVFKQPFVEYVSSNSALKSKYLPFVKSTEEGKRIYSNLLNAAVTNFSPYIEELLGLANSTGVPFDVIFVLSIQPELGLLMQKPDLFVRDCTDILGCSESGCFFAHNEDNSAGIAKYSFWLYATLNITDTSTKSHIIRSYSSLSYPLSLFGSAFGMNSLGLTYSMNAVFPEIKPENTKHAVPRYFLNRRLAECGSLDEVKEVLDSMLPCASGFAMNIMDATGLAYNVEIALHTYNVHAIEKDETYYHVNMLRHISSDEVPQYVDPSSVHRLARLEALHPTSFAEAISALGDEQDAEYPIFRQGTTVDHDITLATATMNVEGNVMDLYRANPVTSHPLIAIPRL